VRFETTRSFDRDWKRLSADARAAFVAVVPAFSEACDRWVVEPGAGWPGSLRVRPMVNAGGIFELTWSFAGPDGRATWEWTTIRLDDGSVVPAVRWRRIGGHELFGRP